MRDSRRPNASEGGRAINSPFATLAALLEHRARTTPDHVAFEFDPDGAWLASSGPVELRLTYAELLARSEAVAAELGRRGVTGERALLLFPAGLEFVVAFFGCVLAGVVAVPAPPPHGRPERSLPRLQSIVADADPVVGLSTRGLLGALGAADAAAAVVGAVDWIAVDEIDLAAGEGWSRPRTGPHYLALLQYTSGSVGAPKGAMLRHRQILSQLCAAESVLPLDREGWRYVNWMPLFHDGGLVGGVLLPLFLGLPATMLAPEAFLIRPYRWLRTISEVGGTMSASPNFGYEMCLRKVTDEQLDTLDLRSWVVAVNAAEPVRAATLERFAERFWPCGFSRSSFVPAYGLAEATMLVSARRPRRGPQARPTIRRLDRAQFDLGRVVEATAGDRSAYAVVGHGEPLGDQGVVIVDPETGRPLPPGHVGEIWVAGSNVADGYWGRSAAGTFGATVAGRTAGSGTYLRTGDLGFVDGGELFPAGRAKDVIIVRGRNHYPQDVEDVAGSAHPALRAGCGAAFAVEHDGEEAPVVVHEVDDVAAETCDLAIRRIRQAVTNELGIQPLAVVLVAKGGIFKTSSGKLQRSACKQAFLAGRLDVVAEWRLPAAIEVGT